MNQYRGLFVGLTTIDIQYFVDVFPSSNKKVKTAPPQIIPGGPATNAAVAFSYLNREAFLASAIGSNSFSDFAKSDFESTGIRHYDLTEKQQQNAVIASVITSENNGERTIFTHHPDEIAPSFTPEFLFTNVKPDILLLDGFYPEFSIECARLAKHRNIPVVVDGGSWKTQYSELIPLADIFICSSDFYPPGIVDIDMLFRFFMEAGVKKSVVTRGGKSILYSTEKGRGEVPVQTAKIVDTLGAGDIFHGAFCYYYLSSGFNFSGALEAASKLASFSCKYSGTRSWLNFKF